MSQKIISTPEDIKRLTQQVEAGWSAAKAAEYWGYADKGAMARVARRHGLKFAAKAASNARSHF